MSRLVSLMGLTVLAMPGVLGASTPPKKQTVIPTRPSPHSTSANHAGATRVVSGKRAAATSTPARATANTRNSKSLSRGRYVARRIPAPPPVPSPQRYKEIQQALADKGYYSGEVNGQWGADSVDALKRFQADQNLSNDGKLTSLSLIALGLGPKRSNAQAHSAPATVPDPNSSSTQPAVQPGGPRQ